METDYSQVLTCRYPGKEWRMADVDYSTLEWLDDSPKPTRKQLDALWPAVQVELEQQANARAVARESALAKLAQLGLTPDEITSLIP